MYPNYYKKSLIKSKEVSFFIISIIGIKQGSVLVHCGAGVSRVFIIII